MSLRRTLLLSGGIVFVASCSDREPVAPTRSAAAASPGAEATKTPATIGRNVRLHTHVAVTVTAPGGKVDKKTDFNRDVDILFTGAKGHTSTALPLAKLPSASASTPAAKRGSTAARKPGRQQNLAQICANLMVMREGIAAGLAIPAGQSRIQSMPYTPGITGDVSTIEEVGGADTPPAVHRESRNGKLLRETRWTWAKVSGGFIASDLTISGTSGITIHCSLAVASVDRNVVAPPPSRVTPTKHVAAAVIARPVTHDFFAPSANASSSSSEFDSPSDLIESDGATPAVADASAADDNSSVDESRAADAALSERIESAPLIDVATPVPLAALRERAEEEYAPVCSLPKCWAAWAEFLADSAEAVAAAAEAVEICADPLTWILCETAVDLADTLADRAAAAYLRYELCMGYVV